MERTMERTIERTAERVTAWSAGSGAAARAADAIANGAALAAFLAAGLGAFAVGLVTILNEAGVFAAPALYEPAGGVSGRTTLAAVLWLVAWALLHRRWRGRHVAPGPVHALTLILVVLGIVGTFPPVWGLF